MKKFLALVVLFLASSLFGRDIAIFGKGDYRVLEGRQASAVAPADPAKAAFLAAFAVDVARPLPFPAAEVLASPPEWGRTVPGAGGSIQYHAAFAGGYVVRVALQGLALGHKYILTLNGNPKLPGNSRLIDPVPGNPEERYFDFLTVTTDTNGRYEATFGIMLPAGPYGVRFYVKDTDDFKIVLYRDYFNFTVR